MYTRFLIAGLGLLALLAGAPVRASDDHDHGPSTAAPAAPALPRFVASSEVFEMVGIAKGRQLAIYVDRFDNNAPVKGAQVDLEVGGAKVALKEVADGEFEGQLAQELKAGITPVTATVIAGGETDLLAADLDVHADAAHSSAAPASRWRTCLAWGAAASMALMLVIAMARRLRAPRTLRGAA